MNKTIPVTKNFDGKPIGYMNLDCPIPITPDFCFGIGGIIQESTIDKNGTLIIKKFDLQEISLIPIRNLKNPEI
jgi:hypothetical protein